MEPKGLFRPLSRTQKKPGETYIQTYIHMFTYSLPFSHPAVFWTHHGYNTGNTQPGNAHYHKVNIFILTVHQNAGQGRS